MLDDGNEHVKTLGTGVAQAAPQPGTGCGSGIRVTDIHGQTLTDTGITVTPNADQPGRARFTKR